jgi:hypothetical protein
MDVFWKRTERERRRRAVLDELMALDPAAREARLDEAIATGDVKPQEKDTALRLVGRLDAIRVMTIRPVELPGEVVDSFSATSEPSSGPSKDRASGQPGIGEPAPKSSAMDRGRRARRLARARSRAGRSMEPAADRIVIEPPDGISVVEERVAARAMPGEAWPSIEWLRP